MKTNNITTILKKINYNVILNKVKLLTNVSQIFNTIYLQNNVIICFLKSDPLKVPFW